MVFIEQPTQSAILLYISATGFLLLKKPRFMFNEDRSIKRFGLGPKETFFNFHITLIVMAIFLFLLTTLLS